MPEKNKQFGEAVKRDPRIEDKNFEIERKFLVKTLPSDLDSYPHDEYIQGYFADEEKRNTRLRKAGDKHYLTRKHGSGLVRREEESEISQEEFDRLWPRTEGRVVNKTRYFLQAEDSLVYELDIYHDKLEGFVTVEVEFKPTESSSKKKLKKMAKKFVPPDWFGEDVTEDKRYSNNSLAVNGLPKDEAATS